MSRSRKSTQPENRAKASQGRRAKNTRKSTGSFKSEKAGKKSQQRRNESNLGFENIQISYGNHLIKEARQRAHLKKKHSQKKKAKLHRHLKKATSVKGRRSLQTKLKQTRSGKSAKQSIKSNPKFKSEWRD